jgi:hypothetical protein
VNKQQAGLDKYNFVHSIACCKPLQQDVSSVDANNYDDRYLARCILRHACEGLILSVLRREPFAGACNNNKNGAQRIACRNCYLSKFGIRAAPKKDKASF